MSWPHSLHSSRGCLGNRCFGGGVLCGVASMREVHGGELSLYGGLQPVKGNHVVTIIYVKNEVLVIPLLRTMYSPS